MLSNIPLAISDLLADTAPPQRLRPLFSIGVHDIPLLEEDLRTMKAANPSSMATPEPQDHAASDTLGCGWIACTTDSILAMKSTLYDILITIPPPYSEGATQKVWPKIESPQGVEMRATQRDLRRYRTLREGLSRHTSPSAKARHQNNTFHADDVDDEQQPLNMSSLTTSLPKIAVLDIPDTDNIVESSSWSELAYAGFMWWASAGEQRLHTEEECEADASLLSGLALSPSLPKQPKSPDAKRRRGSKDMSAKQEMAIIAYFHRLTSQILVTISDIVDAADSEDDREDERNVSQELIQREGNIDQTVYISSDDVVRMGLDVWSETDHKFIEDVARQYFGCRAIIEGRSIDVCGIRIC